MAYVGNPIDTQNTFQSLVEKRFNGDGSTTDFTLDVAPGNVLDIEVFVGNVRQDPNSAYTVSGTTLSFTGAPPSGTNNIYVVHQAKSVGTIDVPTGGVAAGSLATSVLTGQTDIGGAIADADLFLVDDGAGGTLRKTAASRIKTYVGGFDVSSITGATEMAEVPAGTDEFNISDGGTLKRIDFAHMNNTPAFIARLSSDQTISNTTATKVTFDAEDIDTDGAFASNKFTVPSGKGGMYHLIAGTRMPYLDDNEKLEVYFYINGSAQSRGETIDFYGGGSNDDNVRFTTSATFVLTETDYVEIYVRHNEGASQPIDGGSSQANSYTFFAGYRVSGGVPGTS